MYELKIVNMKLIRIIIALAASTLFVVGNNIRWGRKFGGSEVGQGDVLVTKYCPYFHDGIIPANVTRGYSEQKVPHGRKCMKKRKYFPSPYERRHLAKTNELTLIQNFTDRRKALVSFITSDVEVDYAHRWLARVAAHMQGGKVDIVADDWEFMSYFDVTTICRGSPDISSYEFIEPLSLHARNPFSVFRIMKDWPMPRAHPSGTKIPERLTQAIDYILVYRNPSLPNVISRTDSHYRPQTEHTPMPHVKHFMLDAGTSRFDSSLWWFICAYSKV